MVVLLAALGEDVVRGERVRSDVEVAHARIVGQDGIEPRRSSASAAPLIEHVGDRLRGERASAVRLCDGDVELARSVLVEQVQKPRRRAAEVAAVLGDLAQERLGARAGGEEAIASSVLARATLLVGEGVEVGLVLDLPSALPGAHVTRDLDIAVEDPDDGVGGDERERFAHELVRDRVVVAVEPEVRRLAARCAAHVVARHRVSGEGEQARLLLGERGAHGASVGIAGDLARERDIVHPRVELLVEIVDGVEGSCREERVAQVPDRALDATLLVAACDGDGPGAKW